MLGAAAEGDMFALAVALPILALIVVMLLLVEVRHYRAGRHLISRRRLGLRIAAGLLFLGLLAAVFVGLFVLRLQAGRAQPEVFLSFWAGCLLAAVALVWVMLADLREVRERFTDRQHEMWREMARFIASHMTGEASTERPRQDDPER